MYGIISMEEVSRIGRMCSFLGHKIKNGDTEALKYIYSVVYRENPAILEMVSSLQDCIRSVEIENDRGAIYSPEFLYYWGMTCLGEQSALVYKNIDISRNCFKKISDIVPNAEARLAYIGLLDSDEPSKSESNVKRIDILRRWAGKQDYFSRIVLARIVFDQFLNELEENDSGLLRRDLSVQEKMELELPLRAIRLLQLPCSLGHPVAVKFWNEAVEYIGTPNALKWKLEERYLSIR